MYTFLAIGIYVSISTQHRKHIGDAVPTIGIAAKRSGCIVELGGHEGMLSIVTCTMWFSIPSDSYYIDN
jgi:hypothetical protein